jgi:hypothetical protein
MSTETIIDTDVRNGEHITTADLTRQSQKTDSAPTAAAEHQEPLFPGEESERFRNSWHDIQGSFVDEPRQAVEKADELVATVIKRLAEVFAAERGTLEAAWGKGNDVSTEDLRQALRRYRSFFDRLLSV